MLAKVDLPEEILIAEVFSSPVEESQQESKGEVVYAESLSSLAEP